MTPARRLVIAWCLFLVLVGVMIVFARVPAPDPAAATGRRPVFDFGEADLEKVDVLHAGRRAALMRDPRGRWFRHAGDHGHDATVPLSGATPVGGDAQSRRIGEQLALATGMHVERRVALDRELAAYGLDPPGTMVIFYGRRRGTPDLGSPRGVLYLGDPLPVGDACYAMLADGSAVLQLPRGQLSLLLTLVFGEDAAPACAPG